MELRMISYYETTVDTAEYLLFFNVTCTLAVKFDHLSGVAPPIAGIAPVAPANHSRTSRVNPPIRFESGDLIGFTMGAGGTPSRGVGGAWDFGVYNTSVTNEFANPDRFADGSDDSLHAVCPYDHFDDPLRSNYYALFGTPGGQTVVGAECRSASRDIPGTVVGWWFPDGVQGVRDGFAIGDALDGEVRMGGVGWSLSVRISNPTWRDPETITTSHCYAADGQHALLELRDSDTLSVTYGDGSCPTLDERASELFMR
jgi:hypothetical protein